MYLSHFERGARFLRERPLTATLRGEGCVELLMGKPGSSAVWGSCAGSARKSLGPSFRAEGAGWCANPLVGRALLPKS
eukprot:12027930-Alexandrium_andersonii.AAC.1